MKTSFKPFLFAALSTIMLFSATAWLSCTRNKCATTTCNNGGVCTNEICACATGYEGTLCNTVSRTKFVGNWQQLVSGTGGASHHANAISVSNGASITMVSILNFDNSFTEPVTGIIVAPDTLLIPTQVVQGDTISGKAIYFPAFISINYTVSSTSGTVISVQTEWQQ